MLSHGLRGGEIADTTGWPLHAVHDRMRDARRVLRAKNSAHAVAEALRHGLIS